MANDCIKVTFEGEIECPNNAKTPITIVLAVREDCVSFEINGDKPVKYKDRWQFATTLLNAHGVRMSKTIADTIQLIHDSLYTRVLMDTPCTIVED